MIQDGEAASGAFKAPPLAGNCHVNASAGPTQIIGESGLQARGELRFGHVAAPHRPNYDSKRIHSNDFRPNDFSL
jgi:hypothetical protein